jgi:hypothetical protein
MTTQNLEMVSGDAVVLEITIIDSTTEEAVNLAGCTATFVVARANSRRLLLTKTTSDDISITDATAGRIDVSLNSDDTDSKAGSYSYELQITDSAGNRSTPLYGNLEIVRDLIES